VTTTPATGSTGASSSDASGTDGGSTTSTPATPPATTPSGSSSSSGSAGDSVLQAIYAYLQQVIQTLGNDTTSGSVTITAKAKLDLLAGAVVGASLTVKESSAAGLLQSITAATTNRPASDAASA
jgi:hypothetical protein